MPSSLLRRSPSAIPLLSYSTRRFTTTRPRASRLRQPGEPTGPNEPPKHTSTPPSKSPLKVWPIVAIFLLGSFTFKRIVDQRKGEGFVPKGPAAGSLPHGRPHNVQPPVPH